ncbi:MAG: hypothetical protein AAF570_19765, partial [Bacteroidota bacterium]
MTASQGYSIELNDMHGKPRSVQTYGEGETGLISATEYEYRTDNTVPIVLEDGTSSTAVLGREVELYTDMRQSRFNMFGININGQVDAFMAGVIPVVIPTIFPPISTEETRLRTATTVKLIHRYGILERMRETDLGATNIMENLAWDPQTGEPLLSRTNNAFGDWHYTFNFPARWMYPGMGPAAANEGAFLTEKLTVNQGEATISNPANMIFTPGDELMMEDGSGPERVWVLAVDDVSDRIFLVNREGDPVNSNDAKFKVLRSGFRNQLTAKGGTVVTRTDPLATGSLDFSDALRGNGRLFAEDWMGLCGDDCNSTGNKINPYTTGLKGNWRLKAEYVFEGERQQSSGINLQEDGTLANFKPFWRFGTGAWNPDLGTQGQYVSKAEITKYSPYGQEVENLDPLGTFAGAAYGYRNTMPLFTVQNARNREAGFDGFEDYGLQMPANACVPMVHFRAFDPGNVSGGVGLTEAEAHTGKTSLRLNAGHTYRQNFDIFECDPDPVDMTNWKPFIHEVTTLITKMGLDRQHCDCDPGFSPGAGKYLLSAWVKELDPNPLNPPVPHDAT